MADVTNSPEHRESEAKGSFADRLTFWLVTAMVVLAPLPDGSVASVWIDIWLAVAAIAVIVGGWQKVGWGGALIVAGLAVVLCAYSLVVFLQLQSPGPTPLPIWGEASALLGTELSPRSVTVREAPLYFLGRPLLAGLVLMAGMRVGANRAHARTVLRAVLISATLYGIVGLVGLLFSLDDLRPEDQFGALTAFFISKNTTATYLGSAFLIGFALLFVKAARNLREHRRILAIFQGDDRREMLLVATCTGLLLLLLPLTQSRAGLMLTLAIVLGALMSLLPYLRRRDISRLAFVGIGLLSLVYAVVGDGWRERLSRVDAGADARWPAYGMMWDAAWQQPWLGVGLGSFSQSFPPIRTADIDAVRTFNIGHSTPLEIMFEGGIPLGIVVVLFVLLCGAVLLRGAINRPADPCILAALLVGLLGCLHSSIDFSLQIPGYLIVCLTVVGLGLGRSFLPRQEVGAWRRRVRRRGEKEDEAAEKPATAAV